MQASAEWPGARQFTTLCSVKIAGPAPARHDADRVPMRVDVVWSDELDSLEIVGVAGRNWNE